MTAGAPLFSNETARFAQDLLGLMTLEEKLGQLALFHPADDPALEQAIVAGHVGGVLCAADGARLQTLATQRARRGIPLLLVQPPQPPPLPPHALAAGWDEDLAREHGAIAARGALGAGFNALFAPRVSLSPGRFEGEIATSDAFLAKRLAAAWLRGVRDVPGVLAIAATTAEGEADRALALALLESGAAQAIDAPVLDRRAAQRAGFAGLAVAECRAIGALVAERLATTRARSPREAAEAALASGALDPLRLDAAVRGVLAAKHALGLFRDPQPRLLREEPAEPAANKADHARRTMVLLRNEAGLLPLSPVSDRVIVIGPPEGPARACIEALARAGIGRLSAPGLAVRRGAENWLDPASGDHFALALTRDAARRADFACVVLDDRHFALRAGDDWPKPGAAALALLQALAPVGTRLLAILATETPVDLDGADAHFAAVLQCWRPGPGFAEALSDLLSGRSGPQGRLPAAAGRYALGHGLSYGESVFSGFTASASQDGVLARIAVRNAGSFAARETVQLYARGAGGEPELIAFQHLDLAPGAESEVVFTLGIEELGRRTGEGYRRELPAGAYELFAGKDQRRVLTTMVEITPALARAMAGQARAGLRLAG